MHEGELELGAKASNSVVQYRIVVPMADLREISLYNPTRNAPKSRKCSLWKFRELLKSS